MDKVDLDTIEIAYVDPGIMIIDPEQISVPAGTMAIVPHVPEDIRYENERARLEEDEEDANTIPEHTILAAGQSIERRLYPELSPIYAESGGFSFFTLPYLIKKFIIGINSETNEIMWGDAVIYYETIPPLEVVHRDIRESM